MLILIYLLLFVCTNFSGPYKENVKKFDENTPKTHTCDKETQSQLKTSSELDICASIRKDESDPETFFHKDLDNRHSRVFHFHIDRNGVSHPDHVPDPSLIFHKYDKYIKNKPSKCLIYSYKTFGCLSPKNDKVKRNFATREGILTSSMHLNRLTSGSIKSNSNFVMHTEPLSPCQKKRIFHVDKDFFDLSIEETSKELLDVDALSIYMREKATNMSDTGFFCPSTSINFQDHLMSAELYDHRLECHDSDSLPFSSRRGFHKMKPIAQKSGKIDFDSHMSTELGNSRNPYLLSPCSFGSTVRLPEDFDRPRNDSMGNMQNCSEKQKEVQMHNPINEAGHPLDRLNKIENTTRSISPHQPRNISTDPSCGGRLVEMPSPVVLDQMSFRSQMRGDPVSYGHGEISDKEPDEDSQETQNIQSNSQVETETNVESQKNLSNIGIENDMKEKIIRIGVSIRSYAMPYVRSFPLTKHVLEPLTRNMWNNTETTPASFTPRSNEQSRKSEHNQTKDVFNNGDEKGEEGVLVDYVENEEHETEQFYSKKDRRRQIIFGTEEEDLVSPTGKLHDSTISNYLKLLEKYAFIFKNKTVLSLPVSTVEIIKHNFTQPYPSNPVDLSLIVSKIDNVKPDLLLIPVNIYGHYQLFIVNGTFIECYDSLTTNFRFAKKIRYFLWETNFYRNTLFMVLKKNTPMQSNYVDCGVFVCLNARYRMENEEFTYPIDRIPIFRRHINQELGLRSISPILPCEASEESLGTMVQ